MSKDKNEDKLFLAEQRYEKLMGRQKRALDRKDMMTANILEDKIDEVKKEIEKLRDDCNE